VGSRSNGKFSGWGCKLAPNARAPFLSGRKPEVPLRAKRCAKRKQWRRRPERGFEEPISKDEGEAFEGSVFEIPLDADSHCSDLCAMLSGKQESGAMNSDSQILVAELLTTSGAVKECPICHDCMILAGDEDAERMAYGMATNMWKSRERGFRSMECEDVMSLIKRALIHSPSACPRCDRD